MRVSHFSWNNDASRLFRWLSRNSKIENEIAGGGKWSLRNCQDFLSWWKDFPSKSLFGDGVGGSNHPTVQFNLLPRQIYEKWKKLFARNQFKLHTTWIHIKIREYFSDNKSQFAFLFLQLNSSPQSYKLLDFVFWNKRSIIWAQNHIN